MPAIVGILLFMSRVLFMPSLAEHENSFFLSRDQYAPSIK